MTLDNYTYKVTAAGRVNIIGEHVDYCGGKVMPCALSLKCAVYVRANGQDRINVEWTTLDEKVSLELNDLYAYKAHSYAKYIAGSAYFWRQAGHKVVGCDILVDCKVPFGSGLSSSAAIEVSVIAALATVAGEPFDKAEVAQIAQKAEIEFAGVNCGIMDQYASACGRKNHAMLLDCKSLDCEYVPMELGKYSLVLIDSCKPHSLAESKYNERRAETEEALRLLRQKSDVSCLADVSPSQLEENKDLLPAIIYKRAKHVIDECERVRFTSVALKNGYIAAVGAALSASHRSLSENYEVTGVELDALARLAQSHPACSGSRMTGAGFGGCTVSLVETDKISEFEDYVLTGYKKQIGYDAKIYKADISDGITVKKL